MSPKTLPKKVCASLLNLNYYTWVIYRTESGNNLDPRQFYGSTPPTPKFRPMPPTPFFWPTPKFYGPRPPTPKFRPTPPTEFFWPKPKFYGPTPPTPPMPKFNPRHPRTHAPMLPTPPTLFSRLFYGLVRAFSSSLYPSIIGENVQIYSLQITGKCFCQPSTSHSWHDLIVSPLSRTSPINFP